MRKRSARAMMNQGGKYNSYQASYTKEELEDLARFIFWKDPLDTMREKIPKEERTHWYDGSNEKPIVPNWAYVKRRNVWTTHFAGFTLTIGPALTGSQWLLYLEGRFQLGEAGELEELKEAGTKFLLMAMLAQAKEGK